MKCIRFCSVLLVVLCLVEEILLCPGAMNIFCALFKNMYNFVFYLNHFVYRIR